MPKGKDADVADVNRYALSGHQKVVTFFIIVSWARGWVTHVPTQLYLLPPPRWLTMVGNAVATMVCGTLEQTASFEKGHWPGLEPRGKDITSYHSAPRRYSDQIQFLGVNYLPEVVDFQVKYAPHLPSKSHQAWPFLHVHYVFSLHYLSSPCPWYLKT